jgi:FAD:protein FMN transferase
VTRSGAAGTTQESNCPEGNGMHAHLRAVMAMGTRFEFLLQHEDEGLANAAMDEAMQRVLDLHALWSPYSPSSSISHIHRAAPGARTPVDYDTWQLLRMCDRVWRESGGVFEPTVGRLMEAWGHRGTELRRESCVFGWQHVHVSESAPEVTIDVPGIRLDLGAIAKGWALDDAARMLREAGIERALLHAGTSSVIAMQALCTGASGHEVERAGHWRVRVAEGPELGLANIALGVSCARGQCSVDASGNTYGHVMDPRTGAPTFGSSGGSAFRAAFVLANSAALADAWSTAALVRGSLEDLAHVSVEHSLAAWGVQAQDGAWRLSTVAARACEGRIPCSICAPSFQWRT